MKTVVVGILSRKRNDEQNEYLLIRATTDFGKFSGFYYPPGGHIEENEKLETGLMRELYEELGLRVTPIRQIAVTPGDVAGQMTHWWECATKDTVFSIEEDEIADARYFTEEEMQELQLWPATRKFFDTYIFTH